MDSTVLREIQFQYICLDRYRTVRGISIFTMLCSILNASYSNSSCGTSRFTSLLSKYPQLWTQTKHHILSLTRCRHSFSFDGWETHHFIRTGEYVMWMVNISQCAIVNGQCLQKNGEPFMVLPCKAWLGASWLTLSRAVVDVRDNVGSWYVLVVVVASEGAKHRYGGLCPR